MSWTAVQGWLIIQVLAWIIMALNEICKRKLGKFTGRRVRCDDSRAGGSHPESVEGAGAVVDGVDRE
jgi:hypothetical protein